MPKLEKLSKKDSTELIVYQIGEVKSLLTNIDTRFEGYQRDTDKRLLDIEKYQAAQIAAQLVREQTQPRFDIQKIVLAAFGLVGSVLAIFFSIYQKKP